MKLTNTQRLKAINKLLETDTAFEADCYRLGKGQNKDALLFADLLMDVYRVVHPAFGGCSHEGWDEETLNLIKK